MTISHSPFLSVSRKKPRRCGRQDHSRLVPSSSATIRAIRFSKPSRLRLEKGRLLGSAQTRSTRWVVGAGSACRTEPHNTATSSSEKLWKREHIQHASLGRVLRQVSHRVHESQGAGR